MVREIITINVGQAGIQLAQSIWKQYLCEHDIDYKGYHRPNDSQNSSNTSNTSDDSKNTTESKDNNDSSATRSNIGVFFDETGYGSYVPRNLSIDLEPNVIDDVKNSELGSLFYNEYLLNWSEDAANNYARGFFALGHEAMPSIEHNIHKLVESCDNFQGFIFNHSVGGGTGSGLGARILEKLAATHRKKSKLGVEIYPSTTYSNCVVEPYNAMLSTSNLIDYINLSFMMDNEKMYSICKKNLNIRHPSYNNINKLISTAISCLTASLRFDGGELNLDINDLHTNLVPFPKLHFMISSLSPILTHDKMQRFKCDARALTDLCFDQKSFYVGIPEYDIDTDHFMAALLMFRGNIQAKEANSATQWLKDNKKCSFVDWSPCGFKLCLNSQSIASQNKYYKNKNNNNSITENEIESKMDENKIDNNNNDTNDIIDDLAFSDSTTLMIGNNTGIARVFSNNICKKSDLMYSQRAFVHWFVGEGMEEGEFSEARENLGNLEKDYLDIIGENDDTNDETEYETEDEDF